MQKPLWSPDNSRIQESRMNEYLLRVKEKFSLSLNSYEDLHKWTIEHPSSFWSDLFEFFDIQYSGDLNPSYGDTTFDKYTWFKNVKLNFAENLLKKGDGKSVALRFIHESGKGRSLSYGQLRSEVSGLQKSLSTFMKKGDVLAAFMPNIPETVIGMLATTSLGGVFTSTSCDFGIEGVLDRFGQSRPKVLIATSGYEYNGKYFDLRGKLVEIEKNLPELEKIIIVDFLGRDDDISMIKKAVRWRDFFELRDSIEFTSMNFSDPLYIMYSSGTTGKPKCIVHSIGGTLLQHVKELGLHSNLKQNKNIFYFTTCGWMMWNWLVSSLYFGSKVVLFEGSPGYPSLEKFFSIIELENINLYGTGPKFLRALENSGYDRHYKLNSLETILSTGAPLLPEQYDFIYEKIKEDVCISSIAGGTDIIGCFMLGNPMGPVYRGEIQCLGLGMDVACFDESGNEIINGEGELVCKQSFPSRPLYFLNDEGDRKLKDAYFNHFKDVWHHGDFITITEHGGVLVYGRSDATLNPGGVRIGTSEIYRQTETLSYLEDGLCVGRQNDGDVEVLLFVKMAAGIELDLEKKLEIKDKIKKNTTPRHVPKEIFEVSDIPYTRSGKKMELLVTRILAGKPPTNIEAVSNPQCLSEFQRFKIPAHMELRPS